MEKVSNNKPFYLLASIAIILLMGVVGIANIVLGYILGDSPCSSCWQERMSMIIVSVIALLILRYGPKPIFVAYLIFAAIFGLYIGLWHGSFHTAEDIGQGWALAVFNIHTYVWSFIIMFMAIAFIGVMFLFVKKEDFEAAGKAREWNALVKFTAVFTFVIIVSNAFQAVITAGPPPYIGQGNPVRFSINPKHWDWDKSMRKWKNKRVSLGRFFRTKRPDLLLNTDIANPSASDVVTASDVAIIDSSRFEGNVISMAYDKSNDKFVITTDKHYLYVTDSSFNIERWTQVDAYFATSVNDFKATNILSDGSILIYSTDKSWLRVMPENSQDDWANFKKSRESFKSMRRGRTKTVSSKGQFVLSAVLDEDKKNVYLVTVPNAVSKGLKIIGVSTDDFMTNTEYKIKYSGKPEDMEVTDGFIKDNVYYGLSRTTNTVIKVDLASHEVIGAFGINTNGGEVLSIEEKDVGSYYLLVRKDSQLSLQEVQIQ